MKKTSAAILSIWSNSTLIVLKLMVATLTGSVSVLAEAIHSSVDLIASFIAYWAVRTSDAPADEDHPFGHGKYENVSGAVEGFLIVAAGLLVGYEAVLKLIHPVTPDHLIYALGVMIFSSGVNFVISRRLIHIARQTHSDALMADGLHLQTDVYTSVGVVFGLGLVTLTGKTVFDPAAALVVTGIILHIGWKTTRGSLNQLLDIALPPEEVAKIAETALAHPSIEGINNIRSRRVGGQRQVDMHIQVPEDLTVRKGHEVAHELQDTLRSELGELYVLIHVEPWNAVHEANRRVRLEAEAQERQKAINS